MAATVFEMEDVSVSRNGRKILNGINLTVERGQHWVILGGNGGELGIPELGRLAQADRFCEQ